MKKHVLIMAMAASVVAVCSCGTSKNAGKSIKSEVWQTMMVKQIDTQIEDQIVIAKYNNGTSLSYKILDNFGNVALTWDHSNGRSSNEESYSSYKGEISIPSFVTAGADDEFVFRVMEIDEDAFSGCTNVTSIDIPYSIMRIMDGAFSGCSSLEKITVNENNQVYKAEDGVLFTKDNRMLITYPAQKKETDFVIGEEYSLICADAFSGNQYLENITIGNFITAISDNAFKNCSSLKTVEFGGNVRIIGVDAFKGCTKLERINVRGIFPPHNCPTVFETATKENCKLYVPKGQYMNYKRRLEWMEFKNVQEY
ncbi:MAG: leucine-rich repeat domain-containing protein [Bacteroidaceae bacterium]|nr:leucine-rich repeat domain-containing protein [Bacteroidaceae bacterium]